METVIHNRRLTAMQATPQHDRFVRLPNNLLGMVLDHGRTSAAAVRLLVIKCGKGPGFVLNERYCNREYGVSRRQFQVGMRVLKKVGALDRRKGGRRADGRSAFARERLAPGIGRYVELPESLLRCEDGKLLGFVAATLISRDQQDARRLPRGSG